MFVPHTVLLQLSDSFITWENSILSGNMAFLMLRKKNNPVEISAHLGANLQFPLVKQ